MRTQMLTAACCFALSSCQWLQARGRTPPHVVLVIIDTVRADKLGAYGMEADVSPRFDGFAGQGVRFGRAISQAPWTRPSIGSMLTSRYPRDLGLYVEKDEMLDDRFVMLPEVLHDAGFRTIGVTANPNINRNFGFEQGYDTYVDSGAVWHWMDQEAGQTKAPRSGLDPAPDRFGQVLSALDAESPEEAAQPHFVLVNVMEAHEWRKPEILRKPFRTKFRKQEDGAYLRVVNQLDEDLGAFVDTLQARPGWEDTVFVVVSDHGEGLSSHPHVPDSTFHGSVLYRSQMWVPWIMWSTDGARLPADVVVERPVRMLDMMPTLLDLVGVAAPEGLRGTSVLPLVADLDAEVDLPFAFMVETRFRGRDKIGAYGAQWTYIHNRDRHHGLPRRSLHRFGDPQDGKRTSKAAQHPKLVAKYDRLVKAWEAEVEEAAPTLREVGASAAEIEQLEALGYVQ